MEEEGGRGRTGERVGRARTGGDGRNEVMTRLCTLSERSILSHILCTFGDEILKECHVFCCFSTFRDSFSYSLHFWRRDFKGMCSAAFPPFAGYGVGRGYGVW